ncbi:MAG: hypothetical protein AAB950_00100, partial [Patescibacteria group bacterium]
GSGAMLFGNASAAVRILNNSVFVNDTVGAGGLNKSANITLYGIRTDIPTLQMWREGAQCPAAMCVNFTALTAGTVRFNVTGWSNYSLQADVTPPVVTVLAPANISYNAVLANFSILLDENGGTVLYTLDGGVNNKSFSTLDNLYYNATNSTIADGQYTFRVYSNDTSANRNDTTTVTFILDMTVPATIAYGLSTDADGLNVSKSGVFVNVTATDNLGLGSMLIRLYNSTKDQVNSSLNTTQPSSAFVNFTGLSDGLYYFNATVNDSANNVNHTATRIVLLDTKAPTTIAFGQQTDGNGSVAPRSHVVVNVTATDVNLTNITLYLWNGTLVNMTTVTGINSTYGENFVNITGLSDGTYYFNATATDIANNKNSTVTRTVTVDTAAPGTIEFGTQTDVNNSYHSRNFTIINVTATDANLQNITLYLWNSSLTNITTTASSPNFVNITDLADGVYYFNATAKDIAGNVNHTTTRVVTLDRIVPVPSYGATTDSNGSAVGRTFVIVNVSVIEVNVNTTNVSLHNSSGGVIRSNVTVLNNSFFVNFTGLSEGTYFFNVTVNDSAGNRNLSLQTRTVTVDVTFPDIYYGATTDANNSYVRRNFTIVNITTTEANVANVTIYILNSSGIVNQTTLATLPYYVNVTNLRNDVYYFNATLVDVANNANSSVLTRTITIDTIVPNATYASTTDSDGVNLTRGFVIVNVTSADHVGVNAILIRLFNSTQGQVNSTLNTTFFTSLFVNYSGLSDGLWYFNASVNDSAGNENVTATRLVRIDTLVPTWEFGATTDSNGSYVARNFTVVNVTAVEANLANITIYIINSTQIANLTTLTASPAYVNVTNLWDGKHFFNASVKDLGGNVNSTITRTIVIDTTVPAVTYGSQTESDGVNLTRNAIVVNVSVVEVNLNTTNVTLHNSSGGTYRSNLTVNNGTFFINFTNVDDGLYTFNITVNDSAGNRNLTVGSRTLRVDLTMPLISFGSATDSDGDNYSRNFTFINVSVTEANEANITFTLWNTTSLVNETTNVSAIRSLNITNLRDGTYTFNVTVKDFANQKNETGSRTVILDVTPPNMSYGTGTESDGTALTRTNIVVNISAHDVTVGLTNITIYLYNGTTIVNTSTGTGASLWINHSGLVNATYTFNGTASDRVNNRNLSLGSRIIVLATSPLVMSYTSQTESDGNNLSRNNIATNVSISNSSAMSRVELKLFNSTRAEINSSNTTLPGSVFANFTGLADGRYYFNVTGNDTSDNRLFLATRTVLIDTTNPQISLGVGTQTNRTNMSVNWIYANVSVSETNEANITFRLYNDTAEINTSVYSTAIRTINWTGLSDGNYSYNASVRDASGNSNVTETRIITIDTNVPTFVNASRQNVLAGTVANLSVSVRDVGVGLNGAFARVRYPNGSYLNFTMTSSTGIGAGHGTFNLTINLTGAGDYDVNYTINDSLAHNVTFSDFFDGIAIPLNISGNVTDSAGNLQNYTYKFLRPDTNITLYNFTNNSYNLQGNEVNQRVYDLEVDAGQHVFIFENLNLTTAYVPVNVENFSTSIVNVTLYKILVAAAVNSTYTGNATLNLSYNGLYDSTTAAVTESGLTIH